MDVQVSQEGSSIRFLPPFFFTIRLLYPCPPKAARVSAVGLRKSAKPTGQRCCCFALLGSQCLVLFFSERGQKPGFALPDLDLLVQAEPMTTSLKLAKTQGAEETTNTRVGNGGWKITAIASTSMSVASSRSCQNRSAHFQLLHFRLKISGWTQREVV